MHIGKTQEGKNEVLTPEGKIHSGNSAELETALLRLFDDKHYNIVVNLSKVDDMGSSGLRVLLSLHKKLATKRGNLTVRNPVPKVMKALQLAGLDEVLNVVNE